MPDGIITEDLLAQVCPHCTNAQQWVDPLNTAMAQYEINDDRRAAAFLAQIAVESGELMHLEENLNYSPETLMRVWPGRFPTLAKAQQYARNPQALGNYVYASRLGNGDEESGDGYSFRGRGLIQLTGRGNYAQAEGEIPLAGLQDHPELLSQLASAALCAAWYWYSHGLNQLADDANRDNDEADFEAITRKINGALTGLDQRKTYWLNARHALAI
jgi:putative chitinase